MVHVAEGGLAGSLRSMGGANPDIDSGRLLLITPGGREFVVESGSVTVFAEGVRAGLPDGRGLYVSSGGVVLLDLTDEEADRAERAERKSSGDSARAEQSAGVHARK
jgi:hypothetical protein